jgi:hypothetical protein
MSSFIVVRLRKDRDGEPSESQTALRPRPPHFSIGGQYFRRPAHEPEASPMRGVRAPRAEAGIGHHPSWRSHGSLLRSRARCAESWLDA